MFYDFTLLAKKQIILDNFIKNNSKIINNNQYWEDRIIALNVELSELCNEIRFFKYWSKKTKSSNEIIIDELIDCFHFVFSLGNTLQIEKWKIGLDDMKRPIRIIYFDIIEKLLILSKNKNDKKSFSGILFNFTEIAWNLNFSMDDLIEAYNKKNKINFERQNNNY